MSMAEYSNTPARRGGDTSGRFLKIFLIAGTVLFVVLFSAAMVQSFLTGAAAPAINEARIAPGPTRTPLPTAAPMVAPITFAVQTRTAGTLSPYSVDPASITPDARATAYIAPGYRGGEEPASRSLVVVYVTPYLVAMAPASMTSSTPPTTIPSMIVPKTTTVAPTPLPPSPPPGNAPPCNCAGDTYDCGDPLAQTCYGYCLAQGKGDVHHLDADHDGIPCEGDAPPSTPPTPDPNTSTTTPVAPPEPKTFTITVLSEGYGSVSPPGKVTVNAGEEITFHMAPDPSVVTPGATQSGHIVYNLVQIDPASMEIPSYADPERDPGTWGGNSSDVAGSLTPSYTFKDVQSDHTLRVIFYRGPLIVC
jgi:hypothetical protein